VRFKVAITIALEDIQTKVTITRKILYIMRSQSPFYLF